MEVLLKLMQLFLPFLPEWQQIYAPCHRTLRYFERIRYASVATVAFAYPLAAVTEVQGVKGCGSFSSIHGDRLLKAATFLTTKWSHFADQYFLMRLSSGRADEQEIEKLEDSELVARLHSDLAAATGINVEPVEYFVQRWPDAMPQLKSITSNV